MLVGGAGPVGEWHEDLPAVAQLAEQARKALSSIGAPAERSSATARASRAGNVASNSVNASSTRSGAADVSD